jgi:cytoskeletal protein RodZ
MSSELPDLEDSDRSDGDSSDDEDEDDDDEHFLSTSSPQLSASRSTSSVASTREDQPILTTDAEGPGRDATPVPLDRKPHVGEVAPPVSTTGNERQSGRAPSHGASHDGPRKTRVVIRVRSPRLLFFLFLRA